MDVALSTHPLAARLSIATAGLVCAALWLADDAAARPTCGGKKATIVRGAGDDVIGNVGHGKQVIVAGAGNDVVSAKRNKDIVCGGEGNDVISGGPGKDKVYGEGGIDTIAGDAGSDTILSGGPDNDTINGGAGGDNVHGDAGLDRIFGDIQDDNLFGDSENDLVVGGQGIDQIDAGDGEDWLRGDGNQDSFTGGAGSDTLSFATASPPGALDFDGVIVSLPSGTAVGDEANESVGGVESVVGSQFNDQLIGAGAGSVRGGLGQDQCSGFASVACNQGIGTPPIAYLSVPGSLDPGLVVLGGNANDNFTISGGGGGFQVASTGPLTAGPGCQQAGTGVVCPAPPMPLGFIFAWGGIGNDVVSFGVGFPPSTVVKADGGPGSDSLLGSANSDVLWAGETGADRIQGGAGDDNLVGRGRDGDTLDGGDGADQLVTNDPCGGHVYSGGPGRQDVAGFGHVVSGGVNARLGGKATLQGGGNCSPSSISSTSEILEGTKLGDVLIGNNAPNLIIAREGNDLLIGKGGVDELRGDAGADRCRGGGGKNRLQSC